MRLLLTILMAVALVGCAAEEPAPTPTPMPDLGDVCVATAAAIVEGEAQGMTADQIVFVLARDLGESPETVLMLFDRCYDYYEVRP